MKLNNKGWGFTEMFVLMGILIIFLGIAIFFIYRMYNGLEQNNLIKTNDNTSIKAPEKTEIKYLYSDLEYKMKNGTIRYINNFFKEEITSDLISKDVITPIKDLKDNSICSGYVKVLYQSSDYVTYLPYLKCSNYTTNGYDREYDK